MNDENAQIRSENTQRLKDSSHKNLISDISMAKVNEMEKLPEGWRRVRLGEVCEIIKSISKKKSYPYLEIGDIDICSKKYTIKEKTAPEHCLKAKTGNIVISKVRPTRGAISKIKEEVLYVSPALLVLNSQNNNFLFYSLSRKVFLDHLGKRETGTTYPSVNDMDILDFELNYPPLPEQRKIAEILETVDNAIEKTDKIIEKYKRIKQGLMQDLMTKGVDENWNIRSEKTHKFKDSPLGRIPEEWGVVRLGKNIVNSIQYGYTSSAINKELGPKFLRITDIQDNNVNWDLVPFCKINEKLIVKYKLEDGDIVFSRTGATTGKSYIIKNPPNSIFASYLIRIRTNNNIVNPQFLGYFFNSYYYWTQIFTNLSGSAQEGFNASKLKYLLILLPSLPEQQLIAEILSQIDETIEKEQKYKEKLERLKQGLMEDLLTGKVRVNHLINEVEENVHTA